eukprot:gene7562-1923_t
MQYIWTTGTVYTCNIKMGKAADQKPWGAESEDPSRTLEPFRVLDPFTVPDPFRVLDPLRVTDPFRILHPFRVPAPVRVPDPSSAQMQYKWTTGTVYKCNTKMAKEGALQTCVAEFPVANFGLPDPFRLLDPFRVPDGFRVPDPSSILDASRVADPFR